MSQLQPAGFMPKLIPCLLAGLTGGFTFSRISTRIFHGNFPLRIAIAISLLFLLATIVYAIIWHQRSKNKQRSNKTYIFWQDLIAYFVAFDLSMFGWQKLFHLQFFT